MFGDRSQHGNSGEMLGPAGQMKLYSISKGRVAVALRLVLFLLLCGALFSGADKSASAEKARCLASCQGKCDQAFTACKKNATTKTAAEACQKSRDLCGSICVNKTCGT